MLTDTFNAIVTSFLLSFEIIILRADESEVLFVLEAVWKLLIITCISPVVTAQKQTHMSVLQHVVPQLEQPLNAW
jgi:hypothetical protein